MNGMISSPASQRSVPVSSYSHQGWSLATILISKRDRLLDRSSSREKMAYPCLWFQRHFHQSWQSKPGEQSGSILNSGSVATGHCERPGSRHHKLETNVGLTFKVLLGKTHVPKSSPAPKTKPLRGKSRI